MPDRADINSTPKDSPTPKGIVCINCDYDLASLPPDNNCPECGTPIHSSLKGPLLRSLCPKPSALNSASFLLRLSHLILGYSIAFLLTGLLFTFVVAIADSQSGEFFITAILILATIGAIVALISYGAGAVLITSPRVIPPKTSTHRHRSHAIIMRCTLLALIPLVPFAVYLSEGFVATTLTKNLIAHSVSVLASLTLIAHYVSMRTTLAALARRCSPAPTIKLAGSGAAIAALILLLSEIGHGWASIFPPLVAFFLYVSLAAPVRSVRAAIRIELSYQPTTPPDHPTPISSL